MSAIARLVAADEDTVRDVVHALNGKGLAFSTWSLTKLASTWPQPGARGSAVKVPGRFCMRVGCAGWHQDLERPPPTQDFIAKMHRILDLYDHPPRMGGWSAR